MKRPQHTDLSEEEKSELRNTTTSRISSLCGYVALAVILLDLAAFILGVFSTFFMQIGIMISIALLAIAIINTPSR